MRKHIFSNEEWRELYPHLTESDLMKYWDAIDQVKRQEIIDNPACVVISTLKSYRDSDGIMQYDFYDEHGNVWIDNNGHVFESLKECIKEIENDEMAVVPIGGNKYKIYCRYPRKKPGKIAKRRAGKTTKQRTDNIVKRRVSAGIGKTETKKSPFMRKIVNITGISLKR